MPGVGFFVKDPNVPATWDTNNTNSEYNLSGINNLTATKTVQNWNASCNTQVASGGKHYCEITVPHQATWHFYFGFTNSGSVDKDKYTGSFANSWAMYYTDLYAGGAYQKTTNVQVQTPGPDVAMLALDLDNNKFWYGVNGTWADSGDPAAGTGETASSIGSAVAISVSAYTTGQNFTANFGQSSFTHTVPTGFNSGFLVAP